MSFKEHLKKNKALQQARQRYAVIKAKTQVDLMNTAIDLGLMRGHNDYTKFIIISRGRSGTNFLRGMLNSHSQIINFGEIFREFGSIGWNLQGYGADERQKSLIRTDPIKFIDNYIYRKASIKTKAIGFKIFYYHAQNPEWIPVWEYLQQLKDLHVIHLTRQNRLATYLSTCIAQETKVWSVRTGGKTTVHDSMYVKYEDCLEFFEKTEELENHANLFFKNSKKLEITYENLSANIDAEMESVQNFLGVDQQSVKPASYKQNVKPLSDGIVNYSELKEKFSGSPWFKYFEE